jgi:hypothetical protein
MWVQYIDELQILEKIDKIQDTAADIAIDVQVLIDSIGQPILEKALHLACRTKKKCPKERIGNYQCDSGTYLLCKDYSKKKRTKCLVNYYITKAKSHRNKSI